MQDQNLDQSASLASINKYCPECGSVMLEDIVDDLPAWLCPECGYFEYK